MKLKSYCLKPKPSYLAICFLVAIAIVSHWQWFSLTSILTSGDWAYWHDQPVAESMFAWGPWLTFWGMGQPNAQIPLSLLLAVWSLVVQLGGSFDLAVKITLLWPIAIFGFLSPYWFARSARRTEFEAVALAMLYGTTSYFLVRQTAHLLIALVYALAPLALLLAARVASEFKLSRLLILAIFVSFLIAIEIRVTLILLVVIVFTSFPYMGRATELWRQIVIIVSISILLNAYWILPVLLGGGAEAVSAITSRPLFGDHLFSLLHALPLHEASWTGGLPNSDFVEQPPRLIDLLPVGTLVAILIFKTGLTTKGKLENTYNMLPVFLIIWLIGVFLTKQSGAPFQRFYGLAYEHLPAFNLYREAGKFYMVSAIGMLGSLTYALVFVSKRTSIAISILLLLVSAVMLKPAVTSELGTLFVARQIPEEYRSLARFLQADRDSFRVLWVPTNSRWSYFDKLHGNMSFISQIEGDWDDMASLSQYGDWKGALRASIEAGLHERLLDTSIKYVIVPLVDNENEDNFYRFYGGKPMHWRLFLDAAPYLKELSGDFGRLTVYQVEGWRPKAYALNETEDWLPVTLEAPASGVFLLHMDTLTAARANSLHLVERNDGRWYACQADNWLEVALFGCPATKEVAQQLKTMENHVIFASPFNVANTSTTSAVLVLRDSVKWYWLGVIISGMTMVVLLILLFAERVKRQRRVKTTLFAKHIQESDGGMIC